MKIREGHYAHNNTFDTLSHVKLPQLKLKLFTKIMHLLYKSRGMCYYGQGKNPMNVQWFIPDPKVSSK